MAVTGVPGAKVTATRLGPIQITTYSCIGCRSLQQALGLKRYSCTSAGVPIGNTTVTPPWCPHMIDSEETVTEPTQ